ncbi:hypothetical protein M758_11G066600 [Ceratodon purpureus]|uniref:Uncharacterized protein n=1 Tax=Ceratodon purpureus TaxID=3225 RepID=A0A8T0GE77_CERPU|nr:hypothetical protein KC19_11G068300 [Ceratodon purpureus]KAG0600859.1 hypothetical protein M758_11G066600 [Ceratodon purpureus]
MSSPVRNGPSGATRSDESNGRVEMVEQTPGEVRVDVLPDEIHSTVPGDVENQNGRLEGDVRVPLLGPAGNGGDSNGGGTVTAAESESLAEMQIRSRLWVKEDGNEVFKEALETWENLDTLFANRIDKKRKQSSSLRNEIYQLIGFYLVFQGVLMTAVAQSNLLTCHNWWTAFCLSLLASVVTVGGVIQKFFSVIALEKTISSESFTRTVCINRVKKLLQQRERFSFAKHAKDPDESKRPAAQTRLAWSGAAVVVILLIFSGLFLASVRVILCDSGIPGPSPAPSLG